MVAGRDSGKVNSLGNARLPRLFEPTRIVLLALFILPAPTAQSDQRETAAEERHGNRFWRRGGLEANSVRGLLVLYGQQTCRERCCIGLNYQKLRRVGTRQIRGILIVEAH